MFIRKRIVRMKEKAFMKGYAKHEHDTKNEIRKIRQDQQKNVRDIQATYAKQISSLKRELGKKEKEYNRKLTKLNLRIQEWDASIETAETFISRSITIAERKSAIFDDLLKQVGIFNKKDEELKKLRNTLQGHIRKVKVKLIK